MLTPSTYLFQEAKCRETQFYLPSGQEIGSDGNALRDDKSNILKKKCVLVYADFPSTLLKTDAQISFRIPFMGPDWIATSQLYYESPPSNLRLSKLSELSEKIVYAITGNNLRNINVVSEPSLTLKIIDDSLATFEVQKDALESLKNIIIKSPNSEPMILAMPDPTPKVVPPKITAVDPPRVFIKSSKTVSFKGEGLAVIKQALFEGQDLQIIKTTDSEVMVLLTREVTKESGEVEIILKFDDKNFVIGKVLILERSKEPKT